MVKLVTQLTFDLLLPDRFEPLRQRAEQQLSTIIEPVASGLAVIDEIRDDMRSAGRGAFLVFRGNAGTGKSTFLHTVNIFRKDVETVSIASSSDVKKALGQLGSPSTGLRIIVLEEREALKDVSKEHLEKDLHAINSFVRSPKGAGALVVWPCNADDLQEKLISLAKVIGSKALLGLDERPIVFTGPARSQFRKIAENTVATLNQGATLADFGIAEEEIEALIAKADTVGDLLGYLRATINKKKGIVSSLLVKEQCKLWIVVAAGNEPEGEVAALTRGQYSAIDVARAMAATEANFVKELKSYPDKLGILATMLDGKIFHLPMLAALDIARKYAGPDLREKMKKAGLSDKPTPATKPLDRLAKIDFGRAFEASSVGTMTPGNKPGNNTLEAFRKLVVIAQSNDIPLNCALGEALKSAGYIQSYTPEHDFGIGLTRCTDLYCQLDGGVVRLEIMWRAKVGRADIANYALTKLYNYGRAIGYLK